MERAFANRTEAGQLLAEKLLDYANRDDVIVLGLPRGGVPVAFEVARRLRVPLDVFIVRKLGVPGFEELAVGAIASGGVRVLNEDVAHSLPNADEIIEEVTLRETAELQRREQIYRDGRPAPDLRGRIVILVDEIICAMAPEYFQAVGQYYEDFSQTSDEEVRELLARAAQNRSVESGEDR